LEYCSQMKNVFGKIECKLRFTRCEITFCLQSEFCSFLLLDLFTKYYANGGVNL
jgi:hypothetical protein